MYQTTRDASAIAPTIQGTLTKTEVQTLVQHQPLQAQSYAPVAARGDRLPLYILSGLVAAALAMAAINAMDGQKRELQARNAVLEAQNNAIAGCIKGVTGQ